MPKVFSANQFVSGSSTAEEKARFANQFVDFVLSGFSPSRFTNKFYQRLSACFGHIAHYDRSGFYVFFFENSETMRGFINKTRNHNPVGDPHFCFSDVERKIQNWLNVNAADVERILRQKDEVHQQKAKNEECRLKALEGKTHQIFVVVAKSQNTGPFGHHQYVVLADDGSAWKVHRSMMMPWERGQKIQVPLGNCNPQWSSVCVEAPERMEDAPDKVIDEAFGQVA
jgi:hypothetical protein